VPRYDYKCGVCGEMQEVVLPITASAKGKRACPAGCGRTMRRQLNAGFGFNLKPVGSKFPYVSNRLPFNLPGETHAGRANKTVVKSKAHKDRLYKQHGFVAE
jgi:putative FmdB family regulatory protein